MAIVKRQANKAKALKEVRRVLKADGRLMMADRKPNSLVISALQVALADSRL